MKKIEPIRIYPQQINQTKELRCPLCGSQDIKTYKCGPHGSLGKLSDGKTGYCCDYCGTSWIPKIYTN